MVSCSVSCFSHFALHRAALVRGPGQVVPSSTPTGRPLLHLDSTGSKSWFLDSCGAITGRDRRLLLTTDY
jgi:hypothetical protein